MQQRYGVTSNEKCFVSPDFARTHEYVSPNPLHSYHALPSEKSYYVLRHPDFKQQHLVYLRAPPDKIKSQNLCIQPNISKEASVLCSDVLKPILGKANCGILMSLQPLPLLFFKGATTEKLVIMGLHLCSGYILFCSFYFIKNTFNALNAACL